MSRAAVRDREAAELSVAVTEAYRLVYEQIGYLESHLAELHVCLDALIAQLSDDSPD